MTTRFDAECWICDAQESINGYGGGSPAGNTTTVQKSDPWEGQQGFLKDVFSQAQGLNQNYSPQYYPSSTVSGFTPAQTAAQNMEIARGMSGSPVNAAAQGDAINTLEGGYLGANPGSAYLTPYANGSMLSADNPYFQQMAGRVAASVTPGIESQFISGNRMNGGAAPYAVSSGLGDAIGSLAYQNYQQGQQNQIGAANAIGANYAAERLNQLRAQGLAPSLSATDYQDIAALTDAGQQQQNQNQAQLNSDIDRFNFYQQLPYNKLALYDQMINGSYGGTSTLTQPYYQNQGANILGGISGGAQIGSAFGSYGTAGGGALGGILGGLF